MVIVKLLGLMDLLAGIVMLLLHFDIGIGWRIGFSFASYLFFKAVLFHGDIASIIDFFAGIYLILIIFHVHTFLVFLFAGYIIQKAIFSFL